MKSRFCLYFADVDGDFDGRGISMCKLLPGMLIAWCWHCDNIVNCSIFLDAMDYSKVLDDLWNGIFISDTWYYYMSWIGCVLNCVMGWVGWEWFFFFAFVILIYCSRVFSFFW